MGTAHPFFLVSGSYANKWVVGCQPRKDTDGDGKVEVSIGHHGELMGDDVAPYLFLGPGEGIEIDTFVARDPAGRFVAVVEGGKLIVYDAEAGGRLDLSTLGADVTDDNNPTWNHPALTFGPGSRAVAIRRDPTTNAVLLIDPASGASEVVYESTALIWRAAITAAGTELKVWEVRSDTDGNGAIEPPRVRTNLAGGTCRGPATSYGTYGRSGDKPTELTRPISGVGKTEAETFERHPAGGLVISSQGGELVPASRRRGIAIGPVSWRAAKKSMIQPPR